MKKAVLGLFLAIAVIGHTAHAETPPESVRAEAPPESTHADAATDEEPRGAYYGYQIFLADVASLGLVAAGGALTSSTDSTIPAYGLALPGAAGYLAAGPLIHALGHDDTAAAERSVVLRAVAPLVGVGIGVLVGIPFDQADHAYCGEGCAKLFFGMAGFGVGMLTAMATDWIFSVDRSAERRHGAAGVTVVPVAAITAHGATSGLAVQF